MKKHLLLTALAVFQLACASAEKAEEPAGSIMIQTTGLESADFTRVAVELQPANVTADLIPDGAGGWQGTLVAPAGLQTVTVRGWAGTALVAEGTASVTVTAGELALALVEMLDLSEPPPGPDYGPVIRSVSASATSLALTQEATLAVDATDPDGDPLNYEWSRSCPSGTFSAPSAAQTSFWSDTAAACTVTITVTSGGLAASRSISILVLAAEGQVEVSASFVPLPYVDAVEILGAAPPAPYTRYLVSRTATSWCTDCFVTRNASLPGTYRPGQVQRMTATFANHPANPYTHPDAQVWVDDDCGGAAVWEGTVDASGQATFDWQAPPASALCAISVHVAHAGLQDTLTLVAAVNGCVDDQFEENDTAATMTYWLSLEPDPSGMYPSKSLDYQWANDPDWMRIELGYPYTRLTLVLLTTDTIPLELYAGDGSLVASSTTGTLDVTIPYLTEFRLKVGPGASAAACASAYTLEMWVSEPVMP